MGAFDLEVYPNFTLIAIKGLNGTLVRYSIKGEDNRLTKDEIKSLKTLLAKITIFGFNSLNYDLPLMLMAMQGATARAICKVGNDIITNDQHHYLTMRKLDLNVPNWLSHFDISDVAPGVRVSLKLYGGRIHAPKLQDLPVSPNTLLSDKQMELITEYNVNDLDTTILLYNEIEAAIGLRAELSQQYKFDFMSKSDPQVAEHLICLEVEKAIGKQIQKPSSAPSFIKYKVPEFIQFKDTQLQAILAFIDKCEFEIDGRGSIKLPKVLSDAVIVLGSTEYQMGIGGLHSKDSKLKVIPKADEILADRDVTSYYPNIVLNSRLFPKQMGTKFLDVYQMIVNDRVHSKHLVPILEKRLANGENVADELKYHSNRAASYKIVANGSFGKFGSQFSKLYSPDLLAQVTLTGQLSLLMLIEQLELAGIKVVSANTDGFVSLLHNSLYDVYDTICFDWQLATGFVLEETRYKGLHSRDVNNYFAVTLSGKVKGKGVFAKSGLMKNPNMVIVAEAVQQYILNGTPFIDTLKACKDFTKFLVVRTVNGGATFKDELVGRVVRWAYTTDGDVITYTKNGNKVPKSDGGEVFQNLPDSIPSNLDYDRYVAECQALLEMMK